MILAEVMSKLSQEREFGSRFPARIIFVEDLDLYFDTVSQLKNACDITINVANYGKKDVVPNFDKMKKDLANYEGKQVLILSMGEYLRLCYKRETDIERAQFPDFWNTMQPEDSKTRYIMPMFCCQDCFESIIGEITERQEDFIWRIKSLKEYSKNYSITVYSSQFANSIIADANNLEEWLQNWDNIFKNKEECNIILRQCHTLDASFGRISIKPISNPFEYLSDFVQDAGLLNESWEPSSFWADLIPLAKKGMNFSEIVLNHLGVTAFDFISIIARWETLGTFEHDLIWMWYRVYPTDEYFSYACNKAETSSQIPNRIRDEILYITVRSQSWIQQRMQAMQVLKFDYFDDKYFDALDQLQFPEIRLQLLTYKTHEECAYAVKTVSQMLRNGAELEAVAELIKTKYPALFTYLNEQSEIDTEIDNYFLWYKKNKIINRFPGQYPQMITFERFDTRFKQLNAMNGTDCFTLWIDGFGLEYLPVFLQELKNQDIFIESKNIAKALLPTETEYNHQWGSDKERGITWDKWGKLDSISHHGMYDDKSYYSCITYQLSIFSEAAKKVDQLLEEHEYVIITGDHGSSRLAALAFHEKSIIPTPAPNNSSVRSHGRYCILDEKDCDYLILDFMEKTTSNGQTYIVMKDYDHFAIGGNAAGGNNDEEDIVGEIHGGNTPEERLVPVIIVKRTKPLPTLKCWVENNIITCRNSRGEIMLNFNRKVSTLEINVSAGTGTCSKQNEKSWNVKMEGITGDEITISVIANGKLLPEELNLKVKRMGISLNKEGDLP